MSTPEQPPAPTASAAPDDANALRGYYFKLLIRKPLSLILIGAFALIVGVGLAVLIGPALGGAGFVVALLVGVVVVFAIADSRAADAFFEVYAQQRGMTLLHGRGRLPPATPLLRKGDDRYTERSLQGPLAGGHEGTLALYTYEEETRDSDGNKQTNYYRYTVGLLDVPECAGYVPELYCQRKFGLRALEGLEDVFRRSKERVELESEALLDKYEIFAGKQQDAVWLRRLFAPTFIVWLTEAAPKKFAFELVDGTLLCYVSGHKEDAEELDEMAAATAAVAKRLSDEATETGTV
ncbi:MAG TPA: hypothetical protein VFJ57_03760 [Solirubrobacterales bacterium]|nr:hypothetical protein [Solirubrobacterales bacterium]